MDGMELARKRRERAAKRRLGSEHPICATCGMDDWTCLEAHHIAGAAFDDMTATICRNCHRNLTDRQKNHPQQMLGPHDFDETLAHILLGLADFFELIIGKLREFSRQLIERVKGGGESVS